MFRISTASVFRLVTIAAIGLALVNWWPRSTPPARDGSIAWYHGIWGPRSYFKVTGEDRFGCKFKIDLNAVPSYSLMTGTYPDGTLRENAIVYVSGHVDGCNVNRRQVRQGTYYSPDGTEIGRVEDGTGNIKYCQPNGSPVQEFVLEHENLVIERNWYNDGTLQSERRFLNGMLHGEYTDYHPNGKLRASANYNANLVVEATWFDHNGAVLNRVVRN